MTALEIVLAGVVALLAVVLGVAVIAVLRVLKRLDPNLLAVRPHGRESSRPTLRWSEFRSRWRGSAMVRIGEGAIGRARLWLRRAGLGAEPSGSAPGGAGSVGTVLASAESASTVLAGDVAGEPAGPVEPVEPTEPAELIALTGQTGLSALTGSADLGERSAVAGTTRTADAAGRGTDGALDELLLIAARSDVAAAKAEASSARTEAGRLLDRAQQEAEAIVERAHRQADHDAEQTRATARRAAEREVATLTSVAREQAADAERRQERLDQRERRLAEEAQRLAREAQRLAEEALRVAERDRRNTNAEAELAEREASLALREAEAVAAEAVQRRELERVAGLSTDAARSELIEAIEGQAKRDAALLVRGIEAEARRTGDQRARHIVVDAIQRVASEQTAESVVSVLHLPSDEMKGRIIGREGRNIRAFESVTGVNLIIDDTPEAVLLSCFDPVRREVARLTLEKLVLDGRIHPHRIEEIYDAARIEVERVCERAAEESLAEVGLTDLHPHLFSLVGRLRFRTSYGQNVLKHLLETAHIAAIMAAELGLDIPLVRRCAFLHDIGKALTHEVEGSHALIGADVARRFGEADEVVHAIEAHHNEVPPHTVEAVLTQASDACSGGRPGARRESLEVYVKRLERIEEIAGGKAGVEKVFAMQAGREIRVMVRPEDVDDIGAAVLARDVAKQIEEELTYPGQIRVTVVRESRATEVAR